MPITNSGDFKEHSRYITCQMYLQNKSPYPVNIKVKLEVQYLNPQDINGPPLRTEFITQGNASHMWIGKNQGAPPYAEYTQIAPNEILPAIIIWTPKINVNDKKEIINSQIEINLMG